MGKLVGLLVVLAGVGGFVGLALKFAGGTGLRYDELDGEAIFRRLCTQCHGPDGRAVGRPGETFAGKRAHWDESKLLEYLRNPAAYQRKDGRLTGRYMPPIDGTMPDDARGRLVKHVLSLMEGLEGKQ